MSMTSSLSNAVRRPDLQAFIDEWISNSMEGFIADQVMPVYPVDEKSATYDVIPAEAMLKIYDTERGSGGVYNSADWQYETGFYTTRDRGWVEILFDDRRREFDRRSGGDGAAEMITMMRAQKIMRRAREKRVADMVLNATNFTANAITNEWDDFTNATPITDIKTGKESVRLASGMYPNTLIVNEFVFENLLRCDEVRDILTFNYGAQVDLDNITKAQLASILRVKQILVGGEIYDSAASGQDKSTANIWSNEYAMLTTVSESIDISEPSIGRTFLWTTDSANMEVTEQYRDEDRRADKYRIRSFHQENFLQSKNTSDVVVSNISANVSYLLSNITT